MKIRLHSLCLVALIASIAVGCDEDKKSGGSPAPNSELTLKGFQIIRPRSVQANGDIEVQTFSNAPFETLTSYQPTDQIWANDVPDHLDLSIEVTAMCLNMASNGKGTAIPSLITKLEFDRPISLMEVLPEQALFRPHDKPSGTLRCDLQIIVEDQSGNNVRLEKSKEGQLGKPVEVPNQRAYLQMQDGNALALSWSEASPPTFTASELVNSMRLFTQADSQPDDLLFDEVELHCETFTLRHKLDRANYQSHLLDLDYRRALMKREFLASSPDTYARQNCRFFSFAEGVMNGFSDYFLLTSEAKLPSVEFRYSGPSHYGFGIARNGGWFDTEFASLEVSNDNSMPIVVSVPVDSYFGRGQFVSSQMVPEGNVPGNYQTFQPTYLFQETRPMQNLIFRSVSYYVYPDVEATRTQGASILEDEAGKQIVRLQPGASITYTYSFNASNCHFWQRGLINGLTGGRTPGAFNTFGLILNFSSPAIDVFDRVNKDAELELGNLISVTTVPPRGAGSGRFHLIYSSDDNFDDWKQRLALPDGHLRISDQTADGQRHQVCGSTTGNFATGNRN